MNTCRVGYKENIQLTSDLFGFMYICSPQQDDLRPSGPLSGQDASGEARSSTEGPCRSQVGFAIHCGTNAPLISDIES
ncbi:hypothetical protein PoB_006109100 [Plakobranchus ocellatus]|uniref:Uncharacterized protein n=1 Tax=Plakobranchus ocellatus TaxID=259542 RepID=A0AAV4CRR3_9GAST|nr:hypothetical protein PoB_006109100 [Plakobranchus ocellatus]